VEHKTLINQRCEMQN